MAFRLTDANREIDELIAERDALRAALAKVEAERDARVARDYVQRQLEDPAMREAFCREWAKESLEDAKTTARALAMEEAIRRVEAFFAGPAMTPALSLNVAVLAADLARLTPLPPTLKAVPVEALDRAERHLRGALMVPDPRKSIPQHAFCQEVFLRLNDAILNALAALEASR